MKLTLETINTPHVRKVSNATVMPDMGFGLQNGLSNDAHYLYLGGVFDSEKNPVPEALFYRALHPSTMGHVDGPHQVGFQAPFQPAKKKEKGLFIYAGQISKYIGHFYIESLSRLWCARDYPDAKLVWTSHQKFIPVYLEILESLGLKNESIFIDEPTECEELLIPSQGHIFPIYNIPRFIKFFQVIEPAPVIPGKKVFLSRSREILNGAYVNETEMEDFLCRNGWTIFYTAEFPYADRFEVLSSAEIILTIEGAVLLSYLFFTNTETKVYSLSRSDEALFQNDVIFDTFEFIARSISLDLNRLSIPKKWITGDGSWAKYELDMEAFRSFMEETDFLSRPEQIPESARVHTIWTEEMTRETAVAASQIVDAEILPLRAHQYFAECRATDGDLEGAIKELSKAISLEPELTYLHSRMSRLLRSSRKYEEAIASMNRAIALLTLTDGESGGHVCYPFFFTNLCELYRKIGEYDLALEASKRAVALSPRSAVMLFILGITLSESGDFEGAFDNFHKALEIDPRNLDTLSALANLHHSQSEFESATARLIQIQEIDSDDATVDYRLGVIHHQKGQIDDAIRKYEACLVKDTKHTDALYQLSHLYAARGDMKNALLSSQKAADLKEKPLYRKRVDEILENLGETLDELMLEQDEAH